MHWSAREANSPGSRVSLVQRNILANLIGGGVLTLLTILITPLQVNILGMEAYGVVGVIATLQIAFTVFDLGLSATITRELAADLSPRKQNSESLLRTATAVYWVTAVAIGIGIASLAPYLSEHWFTSHVIDPHEIRKSLGVIALYLALRWPVALYTGVLIGMQRMDVLNVVKVTTAAIRLLGGVVVLLHWRSLSAYLLWISANALLEVVAFGLVSKTFHPTMPLRPGVSLEAVRRVWKFSASMNGLAILTILIVQADRVVISKVLPLDELGAYTLAYTSAAIVASLVAAIGSAVLPSLAEAVGAGSKELLERRYMASSRVVLYLTGLVVGVLVFFGDWLLSLWVNPHAAAESARALALLAIGFWCSAAASIAYQTTIAVGKPMLALRVSAASAGPYVVLLLVLVRSHGIEGAALAWFLLNAAYVLILVPAVHARVLFTDVIPYARSILLPFAGLTIVSFGGSRIVGSLIWNQEVGLTVLSYCLGAMVLYASVGYLLLGPAIQHKLKSQMKFKV